MRNDGFIPYRQVCLSGFKEVREPLEQGRVWLACLSGICPWRKSAAPAPGGGGLSLHSAPHPDPIVGKEMFKNAGEFFFYKMFVVYEWGELGSRPAPVVLGA